MYINVHKNQLNSLKRFLNLNYLFQRVLTNTKDQNSGDFNWNRLPADLRPNFKRKNDTNDEINTKKKKFVNLEEKLKVLEEKEQTNGIKKQNVRQDTDEEEEVITLVMFTQLF